MLRSLRVENFILIDKIELDFKAGFNCLTGETGSGKSMVLKALGFLSSTKGKEKFKKSESKNVSVTAVFDSPFSGKIEHLLKENGIDESSDDNLIIRRVLSTQSRLLSYINDVLVSQSFFEKVVNLLLDLNFQKDENKLFNGEFALEFIDDYANLKDKVAAFNKKIDEYKALEKEKEELFKKVNENINKKDYLEYALNEIQKANPKIGEDEELGTQLKTYKNLAKIHEEIDNMLSSLSRSDGVLKNLSLSIKSAEVLKKYDTSFDAIENTLNDQYFAVDDCINEINTIKNKYSLNDNNEEYIIERLDVLSKIKRKYGPTIDDCLKKQEEFREELRLLENFDYEMNELDKKTKKLLENIKVISKELNEKRMSACKKLDSDITENLHLLMMPMARFKTDFKPINETFGTIKAEFLISANKSSEFLPISKTASGGELSRIFLSLLLYSNNFSIPTIVFDEIDSGLGGEASIALGDFIVKISKKIQVISITHLASIASRSDNQISVKKSEKQDGVEINAKAVDGVEREEEIARMLSGSISKESLLHAKKLLS